MALRSGALESQGLGDQRLRHRLLPPLLATLLLASPAAAQPPQAQCCPGRALTLVERVARVDYVVRAEVVNGSYGSIDDLTVLELLAGERVDELPVELGVVPLCRPRVKRARREEALVGLRCRGDGADRICRPGVMASLPGADPDERLRNVIWLQALREAVQAGESNLELPWAAALERGGSRCLLEKEIDGDRATGRIRFVIDQVRGLRLEILYLIDRWVGGRVPPRGPRDARDWPDRDYPFLTVDLGDDEVKISGGIDRGTSTLFELERMAAADLLRQMLGAGRKALRLHFDGDYESRVGTVGLSASLGDFLACGRSLGSASRAASR